MYALDFEYDGRLLSDQGFIICDFNSPSGANNTTSGSNITFNMIPYNNGKNYGLTSTQYDECIQSTFDICKNPDIYDDLTISYEEYRNIIRWLNRNEFLKFRIIDDDYTGNICYYDASFNIEKIVIREILYGFRLTMQTNKPFGYGLEKYNKWNATDVTKKYILIDISDELGFIYPDLKITCQETGNLSLKNETLNSTMLIQNCSVGEVITIDGNAQIINTSLNNHKIYNDFNFEFFKIANTINDRRNILSTSLRCNIEIKYKPIIKCIF